MPLIIEKLYSSAIDHKGGIVSAGALLSSTATFGHVVLAPIAVGTHWDALLWRVSKHGTTQWVLRGGGAGNEYAMAVAIDSQSNIIVGGYTQSTSSTFGKVAMTIKVSLSEQEYCQ